MDDDISFHSLARIRILLSPVGFVNREDYVEVSTLLKTFGTVELKDLPHVDSPEKARFLPNPSANGQLQLSFTVEPPPPSHGCLSTLRLGDFPLGLIGIANVASPSQLAVVAATFQAAISDAYPTGSIFPLASICIVQEQDISSTNPAEQYPSFLRIVPSAAASKSDLLYTILTKFCAEILARFTDITRALESESGSAALHASILPTLQSISEAAANTKVDGRDSLHRQTIRRVTSPLSDSRSSSPDVMARHRTSLNPGPTGSRGSLSLTSSPSMKRASDGNMPPQHSRFYKVLADLFLLAGRTEDAIIWYNEAMNALKTLNDDVWYASALEGFCSSVLLNEWYSSRSVSDAASTRLSLQSFKSATLDSLPNKDVFLDVQEKMTVAITHYSKPRVVNAEDDLRDSSITTLLYLRCVLRQSFLVLAVWSAQGWNHTALRNSTANWSAGILESGPSEEILMMRSETSDIQRYHIASLLSQAHGPFLLHLGVRDSVRMLSYQAAMYGALHYKRKEAYILREITAVIMTELVRQRQESKNRQSMSNFGETSSSTTPTSGVPTLEQSHLGIHLLENSVGNESIMRIVRYVCNVHGLNCISPEPNADTRNVVYIQLPGHPSAPQTEYGWPEIQVALVREAIAVAETLPDKRSSLEISNTALQTLYPILDETEQKQLYITAHRALHGFARQGISVVATVWLGQTIVDISVTPLGPMLLPIASNAEKTRGENGSSDTESVQGPFLYKPGDQPHAITSTLAQDERIEVSIEVWNPYMFNCDDLSISLNTTGVPFDSEPIISTLAARSLSTIRLTGVPTKQGNLVIKGFTVQSFGSSFTEIVIGRVDSIQRPLSSEFKITKAKLTGMQSGSLEKEVTMSRPDSGVKAAHSPLQFEVVAPQPMLHIVRTSLVHGSLTLYAGERTIIHMTLENTSEIPINSMRFILSDLPTEQARLSLNKNSLRAADVHPKAHHLMHKPVFTEVVPNSGLKLAPGQRTTVAVACFGRSECTGGKISVSYTSSAVAGDRLSSGHERILDCPVSLTVHRILEISSLKVTPFPDSGRLHDSTDRLLILDNEPVSRWCLLAMEISNLYGTPFEVVVRRKQSDIPPFDTTSLIPSGATYTFMIPLKRVSLDDVEKRRSVPPSSIAVSSFQPRQSRYQEDKNKQQEWLLESVEALWRDPRSKRTGELALTETDALDITLAALQTEPVSIQLAISDSEEHPKNLGATKLKWQSDVLSQLHCKVTNEWLPEGQYLLWLSCDPEDHILSEEMTTTVPFVFESRSATFDWKTAICFVSKGSFRIHAVLRRKQDSGLDAIIAQESLIVEIE